MVAAATAATTFQWPSAGRELLPLAGSQTLPEDSGKYNSASSWAGARLGPEPAEVHLLGMGRLPSFDGPHPTAKLEEEAGESLLKAGPTLTYVPYGEKERRKKLIFKS